MTSYEISPGKTHAEPGRGYSAVIFDLDGTLCDTLADIAASVNLTLAEMGFPTRTQDHTRLGMNRGSRHLIAHALPERTDDATVDSVLARYKEIYAAHLCDATRPYPGITELLSRLREDGIRLAVLSNKPDAHTKRLAGHCFPGAFDVIVGQGARPVKPSPEATLEVAKLLGAEPKNVLFVGDSDVDMETAHNAGMTSVGVEWGFRDRLTLERAGADYIVCNAWEIYEIARGETRKAILGCHPKP